MQARKTVKNIYQIELETRSAVSQSYNRPGVTVQELELEEMLKEVTNEFTKKYKSAKIRRSVYTNK